MKIYYKYLYILSDTLINNINLHKAILYALLDAEEIDIDDDNIDDDNNDNGNDIDNNNIDNDNEDSYDRNDSEDYLGYYSDTCADNLNDDCNHENINDDESIYMDLSSIYTKIYHLRDKKWDAKYGRCIPLINEPNNTESYCILYGYHSFDIDKLNISKSLKRKIVENLKQRNIGKLTKPCKT